MNFQAIIEPPTFVESQLKYRSEFNRKKAVWLKTGGYCWHCDCSLVFCGMESFHVDHLFPKSLGGSNSIDNLVPSCERCNCSKHNRLDWKPASRVTLHG